MICASLHIFSHYLLDAQMACCENHFVKFFIYLWILTKRKIPNMLLGQSYPSSIIWIHFVPLKMNSKDSSITSAHQLLERIYLKIFMQNPKITKLWVEVLYSILLNWWMKQVLHTRIEWFYIYQLTFISLVFIRPSMEYRIWFLLLLWFKLFRVIFSLTRRCTSLYSWHWHNISNISLMFSVPLT